MGGYLGSVESQVKDTGKCIAYIWIQGFPPQRLGEVQYLCNGDAVNPCMHPICDDVWFVCNGASCMGTWRMLSTAYYVRQVG